VYPLIEVNKMKKIILLQLLMLLMLFQPTLFKANEYDTYQSIDFETYGAKLLKDFRPYDYNKHYAQLEGRRFWGWDTVTAHNNEKITFIKETLIIIENQGPTSIDQSYYFKTTEQAKRQISATGSIGTETSGKVKGFKLGLDQKINVKYTSEDQSKVEEKSDLKIKVDPMTKLTVEVYGEGRITNGVGKYYRFFRNTRTGGWEVFTLTTEYFSVVKERLDDYEYTH